MKGSSKYNTQETHRQHAARNSEARSRSIPLQSQTTGAFPRAAIPFAAVTIVVGQI
jgi:hypothetical protein